jgi:hypothetical protein
LLVSLRTGKAFRRLDIGSGVSASVSSSPWIVIVVRHPYLQSDSYWLVLTRLQSTSHPSPSIHILDKDLESVRNPVTHLPVNPLSQLPIASVSGRLLAYATREAASVPGSEGLGSIVAACTARSRAVHAGGPAAQSPPPTTQGALLSSAVEIGGGVARGVWSGLKMGARMAGDRLAQSAPSERGDVISPGGLSVPVGGPESRSVEDVMTDGAMSSRPPGGVWVKIVDLLPRANQGTDLIAHFRLSPSRSLVPPLSSQGVRSHAAQREYPIALLSFSPEGSRLFAAAADGRDFHVLDVRPRGREFSRHSRGSPKGEVWDAYILRRGNTAADVQSVSWSQDERWIAVGTGKGTVRELYHPVLFGSLTHTQTSSPSRLLAESRLPRAMLASRLAIRRSCSRFLSMLRHSPASAHPASDPPRTLRARRTRPRRVRLQLPCLSLLASRPWPRVPCARMLPSTDLVLSRWSWRG